MALEKHFGFRIGLESSYGSSSVTALSAVPVFIDSRPQAAGMAIHERPFFTPSSISRQPFVVGKMHWEVPIKFHLKGSGTVGYHPECHRFFRIAGMGEIVSGSNVDYSPVTSVTASAQCLVNLDGVQYSLSGTRAESLTITLESGAPALVEGKLIALYSEPTAVSFNPSSNIWTFEDAAVQPQNVEGILLSLSSNAHDIQRIVFDLQNEIVVKESVNAVNRGIKEMVIVGRNWGGSMLVARDADNDIEWWTNLTSQSGLNLTMSAGWGPAGNKIFIQAFQLQIESIQPAIEKGMHYYDVKFRINTDSTLGQEFRIRFN